MSRQVEMLVRRAGQPDRRLMLTSGAMVLGRAEDNDIVLPDIQVSRRHARISVDGDAVVVEDIGSGNGVWYAGTRVHRQIVGDGDEVQVPPFTLTFLFIQPEPTNEVTLPVPVRPPPIIDFLPARLRLISHHRMPREFNLSPSGAKLGRSEQNEVVLPEPAASRVHAEIGYTQGGWWIRDTGSSNGTFINGQRIKDRVLLSGDRIRIGAVELQFVVMPPDAPTVERTENFRSDGFYPGAIAPEPPDLPETLQLLHPTHPIPPDPPQFRRRAPKVGFFGRRINQVSIALLTLSILLVGGRTALDVALYLVQPQTSTVATAATAATAAPVDPGRVKALMDTGMSQVATRSWSAAADTFRQARKLDPTHAEARRMSLVAAELSALQIMRAALPAAPAAVAAVTAPAAAATTTPTAAATTNATSRRAPEPSPPPVVPPSNNARLADLAARAEALHQQGDFAGEIKAWEQVLAADTSASNAYRARAEEGISAARARMQTDSRKVWQSAQAAYDQDDLLTARTRLRETVRIDPYNAEAQALLRQAQARLKTQAESFYKEGRRLEDIDQTDQAASFYRKAISYLDDRADPLYQKAEARLADLPL